MKRLYLSLLVFLFFNTANIFSQSKTCEDLKDFTFVCIGTTQTFDAGTGSGNADPGNDYGCLGSSPNPAWFYFKVSQGGTLNIKQTNSNNLDVDGVLWGPFDSTQQITEKCGQYGKFGNNSILACDYATAAGFNFTADVETGKYYVLLVANYSNQPTQITLSDVNSGAKTDCSPDIKITKTVSNNNPGVGEPFTWNVKAKNVGLSDATNVRIKDLISSSDFDFDSFESKVGGVPSGVYSNTTGYWQVGNLVVGEEAELKIVSIPKSNTCGDEYINKVSVVSLNETETNEAVDDLVEKINIRDDQFNAGKISKGQILCKGEVPEKFTEISPATPASGLVGAVFEYQWYKRIYDGAPTTLDIIPGATSNEYVPTEPLMYKTKYSRRAKMVLPNGYSCIKYSTVIITLNKSEGGEIGGQSIVCEGQPFNLSSITDGTTEYSKSYKWEKSEDLGASWLPISGTGANLSVSGIDKNTTYRRVTLSTKSGVVCESYSNEFLVSVNKVDPGVVEGTHEICDGTVPPTFTSIEDGEATPNSNGLSYVWEYYNGSVWVPAQGTNNQKEYTSPVALSSNGSAIKIYKYRRKLIAYFNNGLPVCTPYYSNEIIVTVDPPGTKPDAGTIIGEDFICVNSSFTYSSDGLGNGVWSIEGGNPTGVLIDASTGKLTSSSTTGSVVIKYEVTPPTGSCADPSSVTKEIIIENVARPSIISPPNSNALCLDGGSLTLVANNSEGKWSSNSPGIAIVNEDTGEITPIAEGVAEIVYTVTSLNTVCTKSVSRNVTVQKTPEPSVITGLNATELCYISGNATGITLGNSVSGGTWSSTNPSRLSVDASTGVLSIPASNSVLTSPLDVTITYTVSGGTCEDISVSKTIKLIPTPEAGEFVLLKDRICEKGGTTTINYITQSNYPGIWSSTDESIATVDNNGIITGVSPGIVNIIFTINDPSPCTNKDTAIKALIVDPAPKAGIISGTVFMCPGSDQTLTTDGDSGGTWSAVPVGSATGLSINSTGLVTVDAVSANPSGFYDILYTTNSMNNTNDCVAKDVSTLRIEIIPYAAGTITGDDKVCSDSSITLSNITRKGSGVWSVNDTSLATINQDGVLTPEPNTSGIVKVFYTVSSSQCGDFSTSYDVEIFKAPDTGVLIPSESGLCTNGTIFIETSGDGKGTWSLNDESLADIEVVSGTDNKKIKLSGKGTTGGLLLVTYTLAPTDSPCKVKSTTLYIKVVKQPIAGVISVSDVSDSKVSQESVCSDSSFTLSSDGDTGGEWLSLDTSKATIDAVTGLVTPVAEASGNVTFTYTVLGDNPPCAKFDKAEKTILIEKAPEAGDGFNYEDNTKLCIGDVITLKPNGADNTSVPGIVGSWEVANNSTSVTVVNGIVTANSPGTVEIIYRIEDTANMCSNTVDENSVILIVNPEVLITGASSVCTGQTLQLIGSGTPSTSNPWQSSLPTVASIDSDGLVTAGNVKGTTTIKYTDDNGCFITKDITVKDLPNIQGGDTVCVGNTLQLTGIGTPSTSTPWYSDDLSVASVDNTGLVIANSSIGIVNITFKNEEGCAITKSVTVIETPTIPNVAPQAFCASDSPTVFNLQAVSGSNINWYALNSPSASVLPASTPLTTNTYYASQVNSNGCESDKVSVSVVVRSLPNKPIIESSKTFCSSEAKKVVDLIGLGSSSYGGVLKLYDVDKGGVPLLDQTELATGDYYLEEDVNGCITERTLVTVTVTENPTALTGITSPQSFCSTETVTLNDLDLGTLPSGLSIVWYDQASGGSLVSPNTEIKKRSTYYVEVESEGCTSLTRTAVEVEIIDSPELTTDIIGDSGVCLGGIINFSHATQGGIWSVEKLDGTVASQVSISSSGEFIGTTVGKYNVKYTLSAPSGGTCDGKSSVKQRLVEVYASPSISGVATLCEGSNLNLSGTGSPLTTNAWLSSNTSVGTVSSTGVVTGVSAGTTEITYTNANGCSVTETITVTAKAITPQVDNITQEFCASEKAKVSDLLPGLSATVNWYRTETSTNVLAGGTVLQSGTYYVSGNNSNGCESDRQAVNVVVKEELFKPLAEPQRFCSSDNATVSSLEGTAKNNGTLNWYSEATSTTPLESTESLSSGSYFLEEQFDGCKTERLEVVVTINDCTPSISLEKVDTYLDANENGVVDAGDLIEYTFNVINTGKVDLINVLVTDPKVKVNGGPIKVLAVGTTNSTTFTGTYTIKGTDIAAGSVENIAMVDAGSSQGPVSDTSDDPDNSVDNDVNSDGDPDDPTVTELPAPRVALEKMVALTTDINSNGIPDEGDVLTYSFVIKNIGNTDLENIVIEDGKLGAASPISVADISKAREAAVTAVYVVTADDVSAGKIENTAKVKAEDPNSNRVTEDISDDPTDDTNKDKDGDGTPDDTTVIKISNPKIELLKTSDYFDADGDGKINAGDVIKYNFVVTNTGNVDLTDVTVTDANVIVNGGGISLLPPGQTDSTTFKATYVITKGDIVKGKVENSAEVSGVSPEGKKVSDTSDSGNEGDEDGAGSYTSPKGKDGDTTNDPTVTALPAPRVSLEKTVALTTDTNSNGIPDEGDVLTYSFVVKNTGNTDLENVVITDAKLGSSSPISVANITKGGEETVTAIYTVTSDDVSSGKVENTAKVKAEDPNSNRVTEDISDDPTDDTNKDKDGDGTPDDTTVINLQNPKIEIVKSGKWIDSDNNGIINTGDQIQYNFTIRNTGNVDLSSVTITDSNIGLAAYPIGFVGAGEDKVNVLTKFYEITASDISIGKVVNTAITEGVTAGGDKITDTSDNDADGDGKGDGSDDSDKTNDDDPTTTSLEQAKVLLEKVVVYEDTNNNGKTDIGDTLTYKFKVKNTGNVILTNVVVTDDLSGLIFSTPTTIPILEVGGTDSSIEATYVLSQIDIDNKKVENSAKVTSDQGAEDISDDPNNSTNNDENGNGTPDDPTVFEVLSPSIEVVKISKYLDTDGNGKVNAGDIIKYNFKVTNTGNVELTDVIVSDANVIVTGVLVKLAAGAVDTNTFKATYVITAGDIEKGKVENSAEVSGVSLDGYKVTDTSDSGNLEDEDGNANYTDSKGNDGDTTNDPTLTSLPAPKIALEKTVTHTDTNNDGEISVGDELTYTFVVKNTGNTDLENVVITDEKLKISPLSVSNIVRGGEQNVTASYVVTETDVAEGKVENTAKVKGNDPNSKATTEDISDDPNNTTNIDVNGDGNPDDATVLKISNPKIKLVKTSEYFDADGNGKVNSGDIIRYNFAVTNIGNVSLTNVIVSDTKVTFNGGSLDLLPVGQTDTSTFKATYVITAGDIANGKVENSAEVSGISPEGKKVTDTSDSGNKGDEDGDPNYSDPKGNDKDVNNDPTLTILSMPSIDIKKSVNYVDANNNGKTDVGDELEYTFVVSNTGNIAFADAKINDVKLGVNDYSLGKLEPGEIKKWTGAPSYVITEDDVKAKKVENTATVVGEDSSGVKLAEDVSDDPNDKADKDPNGDGNPDDLTVFVIQQKGLTLDKQDKYVDLNANGVVDAGDVIKYTFTVTNTGNIPLKDVVVTDAKVEVKGGPIVTLPAGAIDSTTFTATYVVKTADIVIGEVVNQATVNTEAVCCTLGTSQSQDEGCVTCVQCLNGDCNQGCGAISAISNDPDTADELDSTITVLEQDASIVITKVADKKIYNVGELITYTFTVKNTGNMNLVDVKVVDNSLENLSAVLPTSVDLLLPGTSAIYTANYVVTIADANAGQIVNSATVIAKYFKDGVENKVQDISDDPTDVNGVGDDDPTVVIVYDKIVAKDDKFNNLGGNVLTNDTVNGKQANEQNVKVTPLTSEDGVLQIDENGNVSLTDPNNTLGGIYEIEYTICEDTTLGIDINCVTAVATVVVECLESPIADCDGDGIPNKDDKDPSDACIYDNALLVPSKVTEDWKLLDCDGDGVSNGTELLDRTDTQDSCSYILVHQSLVTVGVKWNNADCDGDGVSNGQEIIDRTDPSELCDYKGESQDITIVSEEWKNLDCDGDDLSNGNELDSNTNPLLKDTDGDGFDDGTEVVNGTDPLDLCSFPSDFSLQSEKPSKVWLDTDCDGDGKTNGEEIDSGTVPGDPESTELFEVFNGLTVDGDNDNSHFHIQGIENYPNNVEIFNRWGNTVYYVMGYNNKDKSFKGYSGGRATIEKDKKLATGTYFYIIKIDYKGEEIIKKGWLYIRTK